LENTIKGHETLREQMHETRPRIELIATVFMSIAIALSAYCAYEATRWSGVQAIAFATASTDRVEASKAASIASQQLSYDAGTLLNLSEAYIEGKTDIVTELGTR